MATTEQKLDAILECLYTSYLDSTQPRRIDLGERGIITYSANSFNALKDSTHIIFYIGEFLSPEDAVGAYSLIKQLEKEGYISSQMNGDDKLYKIETKGIDFKRNEGFVRQQYIKKLEFKVLERKIKYWNDHRWLWGFISGFISGAIVWLPYFKK